MSRKLPPRVYQKHGAFFYVTNPDRKWIRLGQNESEMYQALAKLKSTDVRQGLMSEFFERYEKEIIPTKAPRTQIDNLSEIKNPKLEQTGKNLYLVRFSVT